MAGPPALSPSLEAWWAESGRPAGSDDAWLGVPFPPALAGLARGGWSLEVPGRAPEAIPWPGVDAARRPAIWYDSVAVSPSRWGGPDEALTQVHGLHAVRAERRARAVFSLESGDFGTDAYGLAFERGDSLRWLRAEASSARRGAFGALGLSGAHVWALSGGLTRGRHRLEGAYAERGYAGELADALAAEGASGESGRIGWAYRGDHAGAALRLERGHDSHESFDNSFGTVLPYSRRDAQQNRVTLELQHGQGAATEAARLEWRRSLIRRSGDLPFSVSDDTWWAAAAIDRRAGEGTLRCELGGGRSGALSRTMLAPRALYGFGVHGLEGRLSAGRRVVPVWSDLEVGQAPFLQSTWSGGFEVLARHVGGWAARAGLSLGVTRDRALLVRYPLEDVWLRVGAIADSARYGFGLAEGELEWRAHRRLSVGASGFVLWRDASAFQLQVDPGAGLRAYAESRFALFQGDLGVVVRAEGVGVGAREGEFTGRRLPEYATAGASATLTLADASVTLRARNLENRRREEVWLDPVTQSEALGPGRELRLILSWKLFD